MSHRLCLSYLKFNLSNDGAVRDVLDPYELHRTISRAFLSPGLEDVENGGRLQSARPLFRCDATLGRAIGWVLARTMPDWSFLGRRNDYFDRDPITVSGQMKIFKDQELNFRCRCRPSKVILGRRLTLLEEGAQKDWFLSRAKAQGVQILQCSGEPVSWVTIKGGEGSVLRGAEFMGRLKVLDADLLQSAVMAGLGPSKGIGFGLLTLWEPEATPVDLIQNQ